MSVRSIDTQIMITRSADYSRDVGAMVKKPELTQEQLASLQKMTAAMEQKKVQETAEADMDKIRTDKDGGGAGADGGETGESGADSFEDSGEVHIAGDLLVAQSNNVIDIKV